MKGQSHIQTHIPHPVLVSSEQYGHSKIVITTFFPCIFYVKTKWKPTNT